MKLTEKIGASAVTCVLAKFVLAGVTVTIGTFTMDFGPIDGLTIAAILTPCLGATHLETFVRSRRGAEHGEPPKC